MSGFFDSIDLLHKALDVQTLRYRVTANNIANSETPGFKRQSVEFESDFARALEQRARRAVPSFRPETPAARHTSGASEPDLRDIAPRVVIDHATPAKPNGNNVDAEQEAMNLVRVQLQYRLLTALVDFEFTQVNTAMRPI